MGQRVVVVVVVVVVFMVVVCVSVVDVVWVVSDVAEEVEASRLLISIFWPMGGSTVGQPVNSVVVLTLKKKFLSFKFLK